MTKAELKQNITKIKKLLKQRDYDVIDTGIELARGLDEPAVFEALLGGWSIYAWGKLVLEEGYKGETLTKRWSDESWPYFAYALVNLIGYVGMDRGFLPNILISFYSKKTRLKFSYVLSLMTPLTTRPIVKSETNLLIRP